MDDNNEGKRAEEEGRVYENADKDEEEVNYKGWKVMPLIIGNEAFENLGTAGTISNLLIYLITVFNMKSITAATIINVFKGTIHLGTLIGAFLCDTYFGRYKTLGFAIISSFLGLLVMQLTAAISKLHPPQCNSQTDDLCDKATTGQITFLLSGFALLIIGASGVKPCNLAFAADQFDPKTELGKRGINSFFNWYFFIYTFTQIASLTVIVYVQSNVSWAIGFAIPACLMLVALVMFFSGSKAYVKVKASGSPLTSVMQVITVAIKKRRVKLADQPLHSLYKYVPLKSANSRLGYTDQFRFLDKAAVQTPGDKIKPDGSPVDPWSLCSLQQVEEVKCLLRVFPIWVSAIIYYLAIVQQHTYMVFQALQMDRRIWSSSKSAFRIPAASYIVFMMLSFTIFIPIYDRILVPVLRKFTKKEHGITLLQRMGTGVFISAVTMLVAGIVEGRRRDLALTQPTLGFAARKGGISSMSGLWLIPQLTLAGLSEVFGAIGQMEFYYKQFPENMRSVAGELFYCGIAGSSYLSSFLISAVQRITSRGGSGREWLPEDINKGRLDYFYYLIALLGFFNFGYFLVCANWYQYKREKASDADDEEAYVTS